MSALSVLAQGAPPPEMASPPSTREALRFSISVQTTNILTPLRADGMPDYWAALNERYGKGVTPSNNAFVSWLGIVDTRKFIREPLRSRFLKMCGAPDTTADAKTLEPFRDYLSRSKRLSDDALAEQETELSAAASSLWSATEKPEAAAYLKEYAGPLDALVEGMNRDRWWIPSMGVHGVQESLLDMYVPPLSYLRGAADALCARATLRAQAGDFEGFLKDVRAVRRLARHVGSGCTIIERLVAVAIDRKASAAIGVVAGSGLLAEAQCGRLGRELAPSTPLPGMAECIDAVERWRMLCDIQLIAQDRMASFEQIPDPESISQGIRRIAGSIHRTEVDWDLVLKDANEVFDEQAAALREGQLLKMQMNSMLIESRYDRVRKAIDTSADSGNALAPQPGESRSNYSHRVDQAFLGESMPSVWRAETLYRRARMEEEMAQVLVATAAERAKRGRWPEQMVTPEGMKDVPRDIYSERQREAIRYVISERGAFVYSIGENRRDDGGVNDPSREKDDLVIGAK